MLKEFNIVNLYIFKVDNGIVYIINEWVRLFILLFFFFVRKLFRVYWFFFLQVIYFFIRFSENFKLFFVFVLNFIDIYVQLLWIGFWSWGGIVRFVFGGGIFMYIFWIEVKFVFRDGGYSDFQNKYEWFKECFYYVWEMGLNFGLNLEFFLFYEDNVFGIFFGLVGSVLVGIFDQFQLFLFVFDELFLDYVEVQIQVILMQYEERVRQDVEW